MGISDSPATVTRPAGQSADVELLVDSGATYSVLPERTWREIGLVAKRAVRIRLADGTLIDRQVGECHFRLAEADKTSPVVLGEGEDAALLGVVTLDVLGLVFNPFTRTLHPIEMLMAGLGPARAGV
jgi:predicted aspartyl protease